MTSEGDRGGWEGGREGGKLVSSPDPLQHWSGNVTREKQAVAFASEVPKMCECYYNIGH